MTLFKCRIGSRQHYFLWILIKFDLYVFTYHFSYFIIMVTTLNLFPNVSSVLHARLHYSISFYFCCSNFLNTNSYLFSFIKVSKLYFYVLFHFKLILFSIIFFSIQLRSHHPWYPISFFFYTQFYCAIHPFVASIPQTPVKQISKQVTLDYFWIK